MSKFLRVLAVPPLLLLASTCGYDTVTRQGPAPLLVQYGWSTSACIIGGEFGDDVDFLTQSCSLADDGFNDEEATFQFRDTPEVDYPWLAQRVYWVWEIRHSPQGAGRRVADAVLFSGDTVTTAPFTVKLIKELEGVSFLGMSGGCPANPANAIACVEYALTHSAYHDEPWMCIWNPTVNASGGRDQWCIGGASNTIGELNTQNALPDLGNLSRSLIGYAIHCDPTYDCYVPPCPQSPLPHPYFHYLASPGSDPDGSPIASSLTNHAGTWQAPSPDLSVPGCHSETARLLGTDADGGMDVIRRFFTQ